MPHTHKALAASMLAKPIIATLNDIRDIGLSSQKILEERLGGVGLRLWESFTLVFVALNEGCVCS